MATLLSTRWGFLSVIVVGLAVLYRQQTGTSISSHPETYCYRGIRTGSDELPEATCFEVTDGLFTKVFIPGPTASEAGGGEQQLQLQPGYVIPGLWDGHGHLLQYGEFLHSVDLFGSASFEEVTRRIVVYLDAHPGVGTKHEWIRGVGWDQMALGGTPTAALLEREERLRGLYIMVDRVDVHCAWVSQAVLDLLPDDVGDVPGGEIVRDPGMGVFCDNAMDLVTKPWPRPDRHRKKEFVRDAMRTLHSVGLVGMHNAGVTPPDLAMFRSMAASPGEEGWTLRVYAMLECVERNTFCPEDAALVRLETGENDLLTVRSVKLFADGALGSWGSAMLEPYTDRPETSGSLLVNATVLETLAGEWAGRGWQVNIHAIGDRANMLAIGALEHALEAACPGLELDPLNVETETAGRACQARSRLRVEHAQIIHPEHQQRMRHCGLIPSIQPTHATSDMAYAELRLGRERTATEAYRMRSLLDLRPVLGSDFPVEPPDPFQGLYAAVARRSPRTGEDAEGRRDGGWYPEEALTLDQALEGFTKGAAYGAFLEGRAGVIQEGAFADWVVLDRPLEEYDIEELRSMRVKETWVGGRRVYSRDVKER